MPAMRCCRHVLSMTILFLLVVAVVRNQCAAAGQVVLPQHPICCAAVACKSR